MNGYDIDVQIKAEIPSPPGRSAVRDQLRRAAAATLETEGSAQQSALAIMVADDEAIHALNLNFRREDRPTDVLSFPADPGVPGMDAYLGDVAIGMPAAMTQAEKAGHSLLDELALLAVHGVLHLLGYDHGEPAAQAAMWAAQDRILASLGVSARSPEFHPGE